MPRRGSKKQATSSSRSDSSGAMASNALDATGVSVFAGEGRMLAHVPKAGRAGDPSVIPGFDHDRALSVLDNLCDTSGVTEKYTKAALDVKSGMEEFRELKTTRAEEQLAELTAAVTAEREAERAAVDALRHQLEETRARLEATSAELQQLKDRPPPPSEAAIRATDSFRRADAEASKWRSRAQDMEKRLVVSEAAKKELMEVLDAQGGGYAAMASSSGAAQSGASNGAAASELESFKELFNRLTGLWPEAAEDCAVGGTAYRCSLETEDGESEMVIRLVPGDAGAGEQDEEDEGGLIEVQVTKGVNLLPGFMQGHDADTINFDSGSGPAFMLQLLGELVGDEDEEEEAAGGGGGSSPMDGAK